MAILFMEGFEGYADSTDFFADTRFTKSGTNSTPDFATGRTGGQCLYANTSLDDFYINLPQTSTDTVFMGFAIYVSSTASTTTGPIVMLVDSNGIDTLTVYLTSTNQIQVRRGASVTLGTSSAIPYNVWNYVEMKFLLSETVGTIDVYLNGVSEISDTGLDTIDTSGSANCRRVLFTPPYSGTQYYDDMYFGDDSGSDVTDLIGDVVIEQLLVDGAGSSTQFTPSTGSNFQNIDETTPDGDTTYNSSSTATHKDLFTTASIAGSVDTVYAVQVNSVFRKEGAGFRAVRNKILSSATEGSGATTPMPYDEYAATGDIFENDPNGGGNWTESAVNAMEIGYELVS